MLYGWRGFGGLDGWQGNAVSAVPSDEAIDDEQGMLTSWIEGLRIAQTVRLREIGRQAEVGSKVLQSV